MYMEKFVSTKENNEILLSMKDYDICFSCKQHRNNKTFWNFYISATKHERMKCLLCASGLKQIIEE